MSENLVHLRRHLHSIAEVSGQENNTAKYITDFLQSCSPDEIITGIGGNGILARFGEQNAAPSILIRCELDALPIPDKNTVEYKSQNNGVGHKCGHDGHMAIVCGVAQKLAEQQIKKGNVLLLFQPAEETGEGARRVLEDLRVLSRTTYLRFTMCRDSKKTS